MFRCNILILSLLLRTGLSISRCAERIGFTRQAVNHEVNSNDGRNGYNLYRANRKAKQKRFHANQSQKKWRKNDWYARIAIRLLKKSWSPEQVIGRLRLEKKVKLFSVNTIYYNINSDKKLCKLLPRKHNKYRKRKDGNERKKSRENLDIRKSIDRRPKYIEKRKSANHFEGDTIIDKKRTARILTHVEKVSGYLLADILYDVSSAKVKEKTVKAFKDIPKDKKKTSTYDRGF